MRFQIGMTVIMALALLSGAIMAQQDAACPALVETALAELGNNCVGMDRNSACYGYNHVNATFTREMEEGFFSRPADRAALIDLQTINTVPLNVALQQWGVALLNVQANVPNTLPGQAVTFILLGDATLENAVAPEQVPAPIIPVNVRAGGGINVRSAPSRSANLLGSVPAGTILPADGFSRDKAWLRVLYEDAPGWVSSEVVIPESDLSGLPVITSDLLSPMQAFYFRTGIGKPECTDAPPSSLVIQSPQRVTVNLTVNGADIAIGSTVVLNTEDKMHLSVVDGMAKVGDNLVIPRGFTAEIGLDDTGSNVEGGWGGFRPLTPDELAALRGLENLPPGLLRYPIDVPSPGEVQALQNQFARANQPPPASTEEPGGESTQEAPQPVEPGALDCTPLRGTSPTDGYPYGPITFYWDGVEGVTSYRVLIYDENNAFVGAADSTATNVVINMANPAFGAGFTFSWEVQAFLNGDPVCTSARVTALRSVPVFTEAPPPPKEEPTKSPEEICEAKKDCHWAEGYCDCYSWGGDNID